MNNASRKIIDAAVLSFMALLLAASLWAPSRHAMAQVLKNSKIMGQSVFNPSAFRWAIPQELVPAVQRSRQFVPGRATLMRSAPVQQPAYPDAARLTAAARAITDGTFSSKNIALSAGDKPMLASGTPAGTSAPMMMQTPPTPPRSPNTGVENQRQPVSGAKPYQLGAAATQSTVCAPGSWGISAVDGFKPPLAFGPQSDWNPYQIEGCGFGNTPGQVWLTGVKYQPTTAGSSGGGINSLHRGFSLHPDWVKLDLYQNRWSNGTIDVVVDPNASGYLATDSTVTLMVITANGQQYKLSGFTFVPMYVEQKLAYIPQRVLDSLWGAGKLVQQGAANLAQVTDSKGNTVTSYIFSPSDGSGILLGHTLAVVRDDNSASFAGGTDSYDFTGLIFITQLPSPIQADLSPQTCQSLPLNGQFSTNGNWLSTWTGSPVRFNVSWQEQSCTTANYGTASLSAYALDFYVLVPRGTTPW